MKEFFFRNQSFVKVIKGRKIKGEKIVGGKKKEREVIRGVDTLMHSNAGLAKKKKIMGLTSGLCLARDIYIYIYASDWLQRGIYIYGAGRNRGIVVKKNDKKKRNSRRKKKKKSWEKMKKRKKSNVVIYIDI